MQNLKVHLAAYNPTNDNIFYLQSQSVNLSGFSLINVPSIGTAVAYNKNYSIGYKLEDSSQFNKTILETLGLGLRGSTNVYNYRLQTAIKANFEEWLELPDADTIFYDINEPNNGLNKKISRYSLQNDYEIVVIIESNVLDNNGVVTNYKYISQPHAYYDYDLDDNITPAWSTNIILFDEDNVNTGGIVYPGQIMRIKATFTPDSGATNFANPYGIFRIFQEGGTIFNIREASTYRGDEYEGWITGITLTDNGTNAVLEAYLNTNLLDDSLNYRITARLSDSATEIGLITEDDIEIITENNDEIIID